MYQLRQLPNSTKSTRNFSGSVLRPKLKIGRQDDQFEQEADAVADQVMHTSDTTHLQMRTDVNSPQISMKCATCNQEEQLQMQTEEEEEPLQAKPLANTITPLIQRQAEPEEEEEEAVPEREEESTPILESVPTGDADELGKEDEEGFVQAKSTMGTVPQVTPGLAQNINSLKGSGQPLPASERTFFEPRFGRDFSNVRVHTGNHAIRTAQSINARAFTLGRDVVFGGGQYSPGSISSRRLLAHELTHVVQQQSNTSQLCRLTPRDKRASRQPMTARQKKAVYLMSKQISDFIRKYGPMTIKTAYSLNVKDEFDDVIGGWHEFKALLYMSRKSRLWRKDVNDRAGPYMRRLLKFGIFRQCVTLKSQGTKHGIQYSLLNRVALNNIIRIKSFARSKPYSVVVKMYTLLKRQGGKLSPHSLAKALGFVIKGKKLSPKKFRAYKSLLQDLDLDKRLNNPLPIIPLALKARASQYEEWKKKEGILEKFKFYKRFLEANFYTIKAKENPVVTRLTKGGVTVLISFDKIILKFEQIIKSLKGTLNAKVYTKNYVENIKRGAATKKLWPADVKMLNLWAYGKCGGNDGYVTTSDVNSILGSKVFSSQTDVTHLDAKVREYYLYALGAGGGKATRIKFEEYMHLIGKNIIKGIKRLHDKFNQQQSQLRPMMDWVIKQMDTKNSILSCYKKRAKGYLDKFQKWVERTWTY